MPPTQNPIERAEVNFVRSLSIDEKRYLDVYKTKVIGPAEFGAYQYGLDLLAFQPNGHTQPVSLRVIFSNLVYAKFDDALDAEAAMVGVGMPRMRKELRRADAPRKLDDLVLRRD